MKRKKWYFAQPKKTILLLVLIILPSIFISILGFISIPQQKRTRITEIKERYRRRLAVIRNQSEIRIRENLKVVFKQFKSRSPNLLDPEDLQSLLKDILLKHRIVRFPYVITATGKYLYPVTHRPDIHKRINRGPLSAELSKNSLFQMGLELELKQKDILNAIRQYNRMLQAMNNRSTQPGIMAAIARCYQKQKKFPQAINYYHDILNNYPGILARNRLFHLQVIQRLARTYQQMGLEPKAVTGYINLYEKILQFDPTGESGDIAFFKNEALNYLNMHITKYESVKERFLKAKTLDHLDHLSELDIRLRWRYFEFYDQDTVRPGTDVSQGTRFLRLREMFTPSDEKSSFYIKIKGSIPWPTISTAPDQMIISEVKQKDRTTSTAYQTIMPDLYFGFQIGVDDIINDVVKKIAKKNRTSPRVNFTVKDQGQNDSALLFEFFDQTLYPGKILLLTSPQQNLFSSLATRDILINYFLLVFLILTLVSGTFFFFKYIARESELLRIRSEFINSVSHTIKTPLTRIRMAAEKIYLGWISDETKKKNYLRSIIDETDSMTAMLENMLTVSQLDEGMKNYQFQRGTIKGIIVSVIEEYSVILQGADFKTEIDLADNIPTFPFDPKAIKLVIGNLLQNAVKYSPVNKNIKVSLHQQDNWAVISVSDQGMGIQKSDTDHLFTKFYRAKDPAVNAIEGYGLGLYIVRHIVRGHNGRITVNSVPGKGSTFTIFLPLTGRKNEKTSDR